MVNVYKGKDDALTCGSYTGIKLLEHAMKVLKRREIKKDCENWQYAVWIYGREEHDGCYFHSPSAPGEILGEE